MVQTRSNRAAAKRVSAAYCWCAYITALAAITMDALVLEPPPSLPQGCPLLERPLLRGLIYDVAATLIVYAFSLFADNSSVYDPYWCVLPLWLLAYWRHEATDSARALIVMNLVGPGRSASSSAIPGRAGREDSRTRTGVISI